jgi:methionyl-tRNA synthetase
MPTNRFYVTTPIYYVNDRPHVGHAYTTVIADALSRYHRLRGDEVRFVTGTDENSQKNVEAMEKAGETDLQAYLDRMAGAWKSTWSEIGITFDDFIRTTEPRHLAGVERFWKAVQASGDLEKRTYESMYCVGCEGFKTPSEMNEEGRCPLHPNKELTKVQEENWFFKLTDYVEPLRTYIREHENFVQPASRRNEILGYLDAVEKEKLDVSVSREKKKLSVGIPVPGDEDQRMYVWFDALLNYMTAVGYGTDEALFQKFWPVNLQLVGKDILKFHCALWPAMIMSAAKQDALLRNEDGSPKLPEQVFAHGFYTLDGMKISKSLGNAIPPSEAAKDVGMDAVRYYLLREVQLGEDGDFSFARLKERYQADLGNTLGNLVQRVVAMSRKYFDGKVPTLDAVTAQSLSGVGVNSWGGSVAIQHLASEVAAAYEAFNTFGVIQRVWGTGESASNLIAANKLIEETQPFKLAKTDLDATGRVLYALLESIRWYAWFVAPIMPETANKMLAALGLDATQEFAKGWDAALTWGQLEPGSTLPEPSPLFPRLEEKTEV